MITGLTSSSFFFFNDTATTEIYTLSLHDALPISGEILSVIDQLNARYDIDGILVQLPLPPQVDAKRILLDRKSTRLNSSHLVISYAVFCLKKKINDGVLPLYPGSSAV